jgi:predicted flap endonuclease-1-like 5' DNA nuclease
MLYLITQMLACLLFTAALALIAGWLLRGIGMRAQLDALTRDRDEQRRRVVALEQRIASTPPPPPAVAPAPTVVHMRRESDAQALTVLRDRLGQLDSVARLQAERLADLGQALREKDQLLETLKQQAEQARVTTKPVKTPPGVPPPGELLSARPAETDRLQAISGIGPVLERVLNDLGIYRFGQLARLTPDNIEWLASRIDWFPQRIQREDWVGQARRLHGEIHPDEQL